MGRILCLVCIITMMSSAQTQRGFYYQQESQVAYPISNPYVNPQSRNIQFTNQPISENLSARSQDARKNRIERLPQESTRFENGTLKILNRLQVNKRGALEDSIENDNDRVVFPGPTSSRSIKLIIPEECQRLGYCNSVPNHPVDLVENIVAKLGNKVNTFQMDTMDEDVQIAQRLGGDLVEVPLCYTNTTVLHPEAAQDKNGDWYTVLNLKNKPLQGFIAELCEYPFPENRSCNAIATFPPGYNSTCTQKFVYRVMEAIDKNSNHVQVPLKLPSCCSCVITRTS